MEKPSPPTFIFVSPAGFSVVREVQAMLPKEPEAAILHPRSVLDTLQGVDHVGRAVIVVSASDLKHLKIATNLTGRLKAQIQSGLVKVTVISSLEHSDLPKFLKKQGCEELISPDINPKGLKLKLQRLMSLVEAAWAKSPKSRAAARAGKENAAEDDQDSRQAKKGVVKAVAAVKVADDCWIIRGKAFKYLQNMWIIRVLGPSPSAGRWIKVDGKNDVWCWTPRDPANNPFVTEGVWTFYGRQPENKEKLWVFVGETPRLTYSRGGEDICNRFEANKDLLLRVARNSQAALRKSAAIAATFEDQRRIKKPTGVGDTTELPAETSSLPILESAENTADSGDEQAIEVEAPEDLAIGPPAPLFSDGKFGNKTGVDPERLPFYEEVLDELGPKPEMFHVVSDRKDCLALIRESAHLCAPAILWTRGQKFRADTLVSHFNPDKGTLGIRFPGDFDWPRLLKTLEEVGAQEVYFNANLGRTAIFFKQPLSDLREGEKAIEVSCPDRIYEVQRRHDLRHNLRPDEPNQVRLVLEDNSETRWKILNISTGGAGLVREAGPDDATGALARGTRIKRISFQIYGREVACAARVAWIKQSSDPGTGQEIRLGVQFDKITHADREGIRLYVMEENFQYLKNIMARTEGDE